MMKLAFVTPWYGDNLPGGSEAEVRRLIAHLHQDGVSVEVLTTCIKDFYGDWGHNHFKPGITEIKGIPVRRFPVERRDQPAFDAVNWRLMHNLTITAAQEHIYIEQMIRTPALYEHIRQHGADYLFVFIPYMFATTYYGAQIWPERSIIIPCLHDESYARLDIYKVVLPLVKGLVLHVDAELELTNHLFGPSQSQIRLVLGEGVDTDFTADGARFRQKYGLEDTPFVLYAGRREMGKNVPLLLEYWRQYQQETGRAVQLVLIGPGALPLPDEMRAHTIDLGFVPVQDKYDAFAAADIFCMPSVNESFSIVTMEAWLTGTPVLVNGRCAVTREHCRKSNGGLYFTNGDEFVATINFILDNPPIAHKMGQNGRRYVLEHYQWPTIVEKYKQLFATIEAAL